MFQALAKRKTPEMTCVKLRHWLTLELVRRPEVSLPSHLGTATPVVLRAHPGALRQCDTKL